MSKSSPSLHFSHSRRHYTHINITITTSASFNEYNKPWHIKCPWLHYYKNFPWQASLSWPFNLSILHDKIPQERHQKTCCAHASSPQADGPDWYFPVSLNCCTWTRTMPKRGLHKQPVNPASEARVWMLLCQVTPCEFNAFSWMECTLMP